MQIEECVLNLKEQMEKDKNFLWNHPEEAFNEYETSTYIIKRLKEMGYKDIKTNIAKTGVVASIGTGSPCILFRADMDAVVMDKGEIKHTCGHDAHMTIELALANLLIQNEDKIKGTVKLLFQPAEEGTGGAKPMIEEGVLENPYVDKVFGLHVWSEIPKGSIGIKEGAIMASTDPFDLIITGKGGHGALPQKCINPIEIAAKITNKLYEVFREDIEKGKLVVGITSINGGTSYNLIPDEVKLKGICRTYDKNLRIDAKQKIREIAKKYTNLVGAKAEITQPSSLPVVINSKKESEEVKEIVEKIVRKR